MNSDDQPLTKKDFDSSIKALETTLVGGMNHMLETLVQHVDGVDNHLGRVELKLNNTTDDLTQRVSKLEKQQA